MFFLKKREKKEQILCVKDISPFEFDALKEIANIAIGNASIALSNIFKNKVGISLPYLDIVSTENLVNLLSFSNEKIVGIYAKINGGIEGDILTVIPIKSAIYITGKHLKLKQFNFEKLSSKDKLGLQKFGNIICSSYLDSLSNFFGKQINFASPVIVSMYTDSINNFLSNHIDYSQKILVIKLKFDVENINVQGDFLLLLTSKPLDSIISSIRVTMDT